MAEKKGRPGKRGASSRKINIFVEVGSHKMQFKRLFAELERLIESGALKANVFAQTGFTNYYTKSFASKGFISEGEMIEKIRWADVIVAHAGAGNIISALSLSKPLVIMPRQAALGEHTDDHQSQLARALAQEKKCIAVHDAKELLGAIKKALKMRQSAKKERNALVKGIREFIEEQAAGGQKS